MRREPWNPTPAQEQAALALCDSSVGGQARSLPDSIAELRTVERGAFRRYLIAEGGTATLVEWGPRTRAYAWSIALMCLGLSLVFVVPFVVLRLADNIGLTDSEPDDFWGVMVLGAGLVLFVAGMALHPRGRTPPGERWTLIGGAED